MPSAFLFNRMIDKPRGNPGLLLFIFTLAAIASGLIALFWRSPWLLAFMILPFSAVLVIMIRERLPALTMAIMGAAIGTATEISCVAGGVWSYAETGGLPFIPPWTAPLWACLAPALWLIRGALPLNPPAVKGSASGLPFFFVGIIIEIAVFVIFGRNTMLSLFACLPLAAGTFALSIDRRTTFAFMAAGFLIGPGCEALPIAFGAWSYATVQVMGMPAWLPFGYGIFASLVGWAAHDISGIFSKKKRKGLNTH
jgi:uncharacterized membrane protein YoaT (DUF817 family)